MKYISKFYFGIFAIILAVVSCTKQELPKANFELDAVTLFSGEVAHEKVHLTWQKPNGELIPQGYILNWSPDGEKITLDAMIYSYDISNLTNGTKYKFKIQADYGEMGISGVNEIQLEPKDELNFTVLSGNEFVIGLWDAPNRSDILNYILSYTPKGKTITIPFGTNSYQIPELDNDVEYTFTFKIQYSNGKNSKEIQTTAIPGKVSAFLLNVDSPMANELVQFTYNPAYLPASTATSWNWSFGDGETSTEQNPQYTFSTTGIHKVSVQIKDGQGDVFNDTQEVYIWGEKWAYNVGSRISTQAAAIADDGTLYIGSEDNDNFHAINPDGTLKWTYTGISDNVYSSASIGNDGTIYVGSKDDKLHAINPDGSQKWTFDLGGDVIYASPAIASDGTIYIGSDSDNLFAINSNGTQKWVFNTAGYNIRSTPAIAENGTIYITSDDGNLYALNPSNGVAEWSFQVDGKAQSGIALDSDGTIIVGVDQGGSSGAVYAVNPDGTEKWNVSVTGRISVSAPAIANNTIYVGTKEGNNLLALNATNGSQKWSFSTPGAIINSSPAVDTDGTVYFGAWDNYFYAVNSDGTLKYKFLTGAQIWSAPAIGVDGTVYIGGYDGKLYALEMFSGGLANDAWPMFGKNPKHTNR